MAFSITFKDKVAFESSFLAHHLVHNPPVHHKVSGGYRVEVRIPLFSLIESSRHMKGKTKCGSRGKGNGMTKYTDSFGSQKRGVGEGREQTKLSQGWKEEMLQTREDLLGTGRRGRGRSW